MGDECIVEHEFVEDIPRAPSGKYMYIVRDMPDAQASGAASSLTAYGSTAENEGR